MNEYIFKNITRLETPVGYICVIGAEGEIPFAVRRNPYNVPYSIYEGDTVKDELRTDTNYEIVVDTANVRKFAVYNIRFSSGGLSYGGSDEHTESRVGTFNGWSIGIGAYNPNDDEEIEQAVQYSKAAGVYENRVILQPPEYDETKFERYVLHTTEDGSGFEFKPLDEPGAAIVFKTAWIENGIYDNATYESAIDFWLT